MDFLIFAENFGKTAPSAGTDGTGGEGRNNKGLVILSFAVNDSTLAAGQAFTLEATVQNNRESDIIPSRATALYLFRSTDTTIQKTDAFLEYIRITNLKGGATQTVSLDWTTPPYAGTYYYGACKGWFAFWNCSLAVRIDVEGSEDGRSDLSVHRPSVSHDRVLPGSRFTLRARVENIGTGPSSPTTVLFLSLGRRDHRRHRQASRRRCRQ